MYVRVSLSVSPSLSTRTRRTTDPLTMLSVRMSGIGLCCWAFLSLSLTAPALGMMNGGIDMDLVSIENSVGVNMKLESCQVGTPGCFDFVQSLETVQPCCECRNKDNLNPYNCPDYFQGPSPPSGWTTVKWSEWDGKNEFLDAGLPVVIPCGLEVRNGWGCRAGESASVA